MKKKVLSVLLCVAMVGALAAGCGSKENDTKESEEKKTRFRMLKQMR